MKTLFNFEPDTERPWSAVNDGVMGGRSSGRMRLEEPGRGVFEGHLSLENNGGFASVRANLPSGALEGASGLAWRVRGDGRHYELRLHPGRWVDGVAFTSSFETMPREWITVQRPLSDFTPTFRGRHPPSAGPLDASQIGQIGIMLSKTYEGAFRLEVDWIRVERDEARPLGRPDR